MQQVVLPIKDSNVLEEVQKVLVQKLPQYLHYRYQGSHLYIQKTTSFIYHQY
ncbi:hypothetical protein FC80_GL000926 [Liquorilactobacillus cacaonum DSM 21116]|uniref:Uncharacterized protein n=1 Tax=Liquorilactobacillus cacaonum DSM 21116 TaxID=1423729 RepID=A0A0R2CTG6_9LACO|nr:hypothetical protein FC80_GL000926 [Liquorilactobacillus cacaonum DSM 21116]